MNKFNFVHLRLHTEFSIVDSTIKIPDIVSRASRDGQPALGLTDNGNTFAYLKFYKSARQVGLKPILGVDIGVQHSSGLLEVDRVLLLCMNYSGYKKLCRLLSMAWLSNTSRQGYINFDWLKQDDNLSFGTMSDDLICLVGGLSGYIFSVAILNSAPFDKRRSIIKDILSVDRDVLLREAL